MKYLSIIFIAFIVADICALSADIDSGLRVYDGTRSVRIAGEPIGTLTSAYRIDKNGKKVGIVLVPLNDPNATKVHVNTKNGVMAWKEYKPANDPCDPTAPGGMITFERLPNGTVPGDRLQISDQYWASHGVRFRLEGGGYPEIAHAGGLITAFVCDNCLWPWDYIQAGENLGSIFLTDNGYFAPNGATPHLIVEYATPVAAASAVLIDVDAAEKWVIEAKNASGVTIDTKTVGPFNNLKHNGRGVGFSFSHATADIYSLRFTGTKGGQNNFGLGFDNFSASGVCSYP